MDIAGYLEEVSQRHGCTKDTNKRRYGACLKLLYPLGADFEIEVETL